MASKRPKSRKKKDPDKLTPIEERFVSEFLIDFNATQAAIRAGYSPGAAHQQGAKTKRRPRVAAEIARRRSLQVKKSDLERGRILEHLAAICYGDMRDFWEENPHDRNAPPLLKPISEWSEEMGRACSSITVRPGKWGDTISVKLWDKNDAIRQGREELGPPPKNEETIWKKIFGDAPHPSEVRIEIPRMREDVPEGPSGSGDSGVDS